MCRLFLFVSIFACSLSANAQSTKVVTGADQLDLLLPKISGKRIAIVANQTSMIGSTHLVDTLKSLGVSTEGNGQKGTIVKAFASQHGFRDGVIVKAFAVEHGFRGTAADGELINDSIDDASGIRIVSIYGKTRKPTAAQMADVDVVIFDMQDVGTRFYTYISTLNYVMEACAENGKTLIILDRPNPNAFVDGPILQPQLKSFVGMNPVPIAHGMTIGEYAQMINGEGWLENKIKCNIEIIKLKNWKHDDSYSLPIRPSPNLPNDQAIRLYPSICLFEGTVISLGRGTPFPFQALGNPELKSMKFTFTPVTIKGVAVKPPQENKLCYGVDLRHAKPERKVDLKYLIEFYKAYPDKEKFFIPYFDKLAGTTVLKQQIKDGMTEAQIRKTWKKDLDAFKEKRKKYLLYP